MLSVWLLEDRVLVFLKSMLPQLMAVWVRYLTGRLFLVRIALMLNPVGSSFIAANDRVIIIIIIRLPAGIFVVFAAAVMSAPAGVLSIPAKALPHLLSWTSLQNCGPEPLSLV